MAFSKTKPWIKKIFNYNPAASGIVAFSLSLFFSSYISNTEYKLIKSGQEQFVNLKLNEIQNQLISALNEGKSAMKTLAYLAENYELDPDFENIGERILESNPKVDVIELLDSGKITAVYPIPGNESVIGYDILTNPETRDEAMESIRRNDVYFAGPLRLKQGGTGIVGRLPIFKNNEFKGFAAVIIYLNSLIDSSQINKKEDDFYYQLTKVNPYTGDIEEFLPMPFPAEQLRGHRSSLFMKEGGWILSVQHKQSPLNSRLIFQLLLNTLVSAILGLFIWNLARQPALLSKKVEEQSKALQKSNQRYELAIQATSDVIWDWDLKTGTVYRSPQFKKLVGDHHYQNQNTVDFWESLIHPDDINEVTNDLYRAFENNSSYWEKEFRIKGINDTYRHVIDKGCIVRDEKGTVVRIIGAIQDITDRKQSEQTLQQEKDRLQYVIEGINAAIWEWNIQTGETVYNEIWASMLGYTLEELTPVSIDTWVHLSHPDDIEKSREALSFYFQGLSPIYEAEYRMKHKNGNWVWVLDKGKIFSWTEDGKPLMMFGIHFDITEKKIREEEIRLANEKLKAANEDLKLFASLASHDMKEPLRMITSFLSLLKKKYQDILDEKGNQYIDFAVDGAARLGKFITDLLDYSKIGFDINLAETINTRNLLYEILELKKQLILESDAEIILGELPTIQAVKIPVQLLFQNLLGNALKFRRKGVKPIIKIEGHETKEYWEFSISDNGIGIDTEYFEKVFEIMVRLHSKNQYPGTGMGLAVCKKIVNQHGGSIHIESILGEGSKFIFTLKKI